VTEQSLAELVEKARKDIKYNARRRAGKPARERRAWQRELEWLLYFHGHLLAEADWEWLATVHAPTAADTTPLEQIRSALHRREHQERRERLRETLATMRRFGMPVPPNLAFWDRDPHAGPAPT
jgi:hypothetical protein